MYFAKLLSSFILAVNAAASPLASKRTSLSKRQATSDGQAGAYIEAPEGTAYVFVGGNVTMPDLGNAAPNTLVSYWIGIDGVYEDANLEQIVIQAGFDAEKGADGTVTYKAFYEWFPNPATFLAEGELNANAGDSIYLTIGISDGLSAYASFVGAGHSITKQFYSPGDEYDARGANAQWVIERPPGKTLPDFGKIEFTQCTAAAQNQNPPQDVSGGTTLDLIDGPSGNTLATGAIIGPNEVEITYIGPVPPPAL